MAKCFLYTNDGFYAGESEAYRRLPANATFEAPPARPWTGKWPRFAGGRWVFEEDHRERNPQLFGGDAQEGTDYWLAEDNWESQGRKMTRPGPLPEGALLARPEIPEGEKLAAAKTRKLEEIEAAYQSALAASLTMPQDSPGHADIAVGAALFAAEDAEGLDYVAQTHAAAREKLAKLVEEATTVEDVEKISVSYAV